MDTSNTEGSNTEQHGHASRAEEQKTNHISLIAVASSRIAAIGYELATQTLAVQFTPKTGESTGPIYHYFDVPAAEYEHFKNAESMGSYFYEHINRKWNYQRIEPDTGTVKVVRTKPDEAGDQNGGSNYAGERANGEKAAA